MARGQPRPGEELTGSLRNRPRNVGHGDTPPIEKSIHGCIVRFTPAHFDKHRSRYSYEGMPLMRNCQNGPGTLP